MKWIRTAITVVIMVVSVGVIVLGINNLTQEKVRDEVVTFEVLTYNGSSGTLTEGTYDNISLYAKISNNGSITNIISYKKNGIETNEYENKFGILGNTKFLFWYDSIGDDTNLGINEDDSFDDDGSIIPPIVGDTFEIVFEVPQPPIITGTIAIILGLVPLIVASGVLYFMLRKNSLGD